MKWKVNFPKSWELAYYFAKFIGLAPFTVKNNVFHRPNLFGKLYPILVTASYLLFGIITFSTANFTVVHFSLFIVLWNVLIHLISFLSVVSTPITLLLVHENIVYLMNKLCIVSNELKSLGVEKDYEKLFKNLFMTTVMANSALIVTCVVLLILEPHWHTFSSIKYFIENWFSLNTILMFVQILFFIKQRFTFVNERLFNLLTPASNISPSHQVRSVIVTSRKARGENNPGSQGLSDLQRIRKIKILHLELRDLVHRTTHIFAIPILLTSIRFSVQFMLASYSVLGAVLNPGQFEWSSVLCSVLRMIIMVALLFIVAYASSVTCEQGNFTKAVLFKTWIKFRPVELADELLHTPITVSAFGFVALDFSFVTKIFSIVATYLAIMFQFEVVMPET